MQYKMRWGERPLRYLLILGLLLPFLLPNQRVYACSCVPPEPVDVALGKTSAVFSGKVTDVARTPIWVDSDIGAATKIRLQTINVWKGDPYETIVVNTGRGGGDCGITDMRVGSEWLVYANGDQDFLRTGICTLTKPLADASNDLAVLGAGDVPTLAGANEPLPHSNSGWLLGLCTAVVAFLVAAFLIFRRRSQPDANYG